MTFDTQSSRQSERKGRRAGVPGPSPSWVFWGWLGALALALAIWVALVWVVLG